MVRPGGARPVKARCGVAVAFRFGVASCGLVWTARRSLSFARLGMAVNTSLTVFRA